MQLIKVEGDLIVLAQNGNFDAVTHGCNCFNTMGAGIAPQMVRAFGCDKMVMEGHGYYADMNKLGQIEMHTTEYDARAKGNPLKAVNSYTQYEPGRNLDYAALEMCFKKLNYYFEGFVVGMPRIGCGIAGGKWERVERMINRTMKKVKAVVVVEYNPKVNSRVLIPIHDE